MAGSNKVPRRGGGIVLAISVEGTHSAAATCVFACSDRLLELRYRDIGGLVGVDYCGGLQETKKHFPFLIVCPPPLLLLLLLLCLLADEIPNLPPVPELPVKSSSYLGSSAVQKVGACHGDENSRIKRLWCQPGRRNLQLLHASFSKYYRP